MYDNTINPMLATPVPVNNSETTGINIALARGGSIAGAVLGAFIMALIESLVAGYLSAAYSEVFIFGIMILVLLFRPMGLFGREVWRP